MKRKVDAGHSYESQQRNRKRRGVTPCEKEYGLLQETSGEPMVVDRWWRTTIAVPTVIDY